ncbi:unnamed protein product [Tuber aestivum]|uniref:Uncharacterized protein n=1 Tax=Tuber aestivum TaxID=59557 RepID=A0A292Q0B5_9PEZI|nr:unnamed protein product [Tuber aestivum]
MTRLLRKTNEAAKTAPQKPTENTAGYSTPPWIAPIVWLVALSILVCGAMVRGHSCGLMVGYLYARHNFYLHQPSEPILGKAESNLDFLL